MMTTRDAVKSPFSLRDHVRTRVPAELTERAQWVCWRYVPDPSRAKPKKVPICPATGEFAAADDPSSWGNFDEASTRHEQGGCEGLGFVFTADDPYCGIDLDNCFENDTDALNEDAQDLVNRLDSYNELSPSGEGMHIIVAAKLPGKGRKRGGIEIYDRLRYFTVTGDSDPTVPQLIRPAQEVVDELYARLQPPKKLPSINRDARAFVGPELPDAAVLDAIRASRHGRWFHSMYEGRGGERYGSRSEADLALTGLIADFVGNNPAQIDRIFRGSALYRGKWDEQRGAHTYGEMTVNKALGE